MPISQQKLATTLARLHRRVSAHYPHVRQNGNLVHCDYLAGPIPFGCYAEINPTLGACLFRAVLGSPIAPDKRALVMEYMTRANYELAAGSWTMDLDSGEVRWKSGFFFGDVPPTVVLMDKLLASSKALIYRYVFGIVAIVAGRSLSEALAQIGTDHGSGSFKGE